MKVMISGGTGMIGWALAQDFSRNGHEAILLTRKTNPVRVMRQRNSYPPLGWDFGGRLGY